MNGKARAYLLIAATLAIALTLCFLRAMFAREAVKRDLGERGCIPRRIWWQPFTFWAVGWWDIPFRVVYLDAEDRLHKASCCVYKTLMDSPFDRRRVKWIKDEVRDFIDV
jgi:hypothetical protein